jgi:uncharacterized protein (DUF924 family)
MTPEPVLEFWFSDAVRQKWWARDDAFDQEICTRFGPWNEKAAAGGLHEWAGSRTGTLALLILTDQFSRNLFRGSPRAFASDAYALGLAKQSIARGDDWATPADQRMLFYLPFMHSENLADQDRCVQLYAERVGDTNQLKHAEMHRAVIARFGRFPHRNPVLGRAPTAAEAAYLAAGGYSP